MRPKWLKLKKQRNNAISNEIPADPHECFSYRQHILPTNAHILDFLVFQNGQNKLTTTTTSTPVSSITMAISIIETPMVTVLVTASVVNVIPLRHSAVSVTLAYDNWLFTTQRSWPVLYTSSAGSAARSPCCPRLPLTYFHNTVTHSKWHAE